MRRRTLTPGEVSGEPSWPSTQSAFEGLGLVSLAPAIALYIHFPWCTRKCPYCDFNSHAVSGEIPETAYIQQLLLDLDQDLLLLDDTPTVTSIFLGGGTPSLFQPAAISTLLTGIQQRLKLDPEAEITLEANPGATDYAKFSGYVQAGVNRLSMGVQSFNDIQRALLR